jgi:hypothetical protein
MRTGLALLLATVLLAGCGGGQSGNGEASKSPDAVLSDASKAASGATTVHVTGEIDSGSRRIGMDLELAKGRGATGSMTLDGKSFDLIRIGDRVYIRGSKPFLKLYAGAYAGALEGRWLKASASSGRLQQFTPLTSAAALFTLIRSSHGKLVNDGVKTYLGRRAIEIRDTSDNSKLYVAATGTPYPVAIAGPKAAAGAIRFSDWNRHVSLTAPKKTFDLSQLGAG